MSDVINLRAMALCAEYDGCRAAEVLARELEKRTVPAPEKGKIILRLNAALPHEGFAARVSRGDLIIEASGGRGLLYGVGKVLRTAVYRDGEALLDEGFFSVERPRRALRGHQLGYRPKTNAYDAWTPEIYDQYIRELAIFGANAVEFIPPNSDDDPDSPHFHEKPLDMLEKCSAIAHSYGMEVWVWYPNMGEDYTDPAVIAESLAEREEVFSRIPYLDALCVPGGDPGEEPPASMFAWIEKERECVRKYHPDCKIWASPQYFCPAEGMVDAFYAENAKLPHRLDGLVFGPWECDPLPVMREKAPDMPIRFYPDITHNFGCQYPVPFWDRSYAMALGREGVTPRPNAFKRINNLLSDYTVGSLTYSEGINDDLNKFVWSGQDWNPDLPAERTVYEYCSFFIDSALAPRLTKLIFLLEKALSYPLETNPVIPVCFEEFREVKNALPLRGRESYRFLLLYLRAMFDRYSMLKRADNAAAERAARELLSAADRSSVRALTRRAVELMTASRDKIHDPALRDEILSLCDTLYEKIGAQLTVGRHGGIAHHRGAFVESIDMPLGNIPYLTAMLTSALKDEDSHIVLPNVRRILDREKVPSDGVYLDFGEDFAFRQTNLDLRALRGDPEFFSNPLRGFRGELANPAQPLVWYDRIMSWQRASFVWCKYAYPLELHFDGLSARDYTLRLSLSGRADPKAAVLDTAAGKLTPVCVEGELVYSVPARAVTEGRLEVRLQAPVGSELPAISELWLV